MPSQCRAGALALAATLSLGIAAARADDGPKYPELNGQWNRASAGAQWDPTEPGGLRQQAPLTTEYQAIFEANLKSLASGNEGYNSHSRCIPAGMPRMMLAYEPLDVIVTPETTGIPMHEDNNTVINERIFLDKANRDVLHDEVTTIDDALTRPWTVTRSYNRERNPVWPEFICAEDNHHVMVGPETYFRSVDGLLMPTRKDQPPPGLRDFDQPPK